jgi:predicted MFS family arabinose efflux permease
MLPLIGDIAPPHRRASSLAVIVSGLMLGMLVARLFSGIVANYTSWRNIYWFSFGVQHLLIVALYLFMPDYPSTNTDLSYPTVLFSILRMMVTKPLLVQACIIALCMGAAFTAFWTTLTDLLASPPYDYPPVTIGLFSLIGLFVITSGPFYGRYFTDRYVPWLSSLVGQIIALAGATIGTFTGKITVAGPIIQALSIDIGTQTAHVANRASIYTIDPKARNRLNTAYMVMAFVGQLSGTAIGNRLYREGGWTWSGATASKSSFCFSLFFLTSYPYYPYPCRHTVSLTLTSAVAFLIFAIITSLAKGPHEKGWFGWSGGTRMKGVVPSKHDKEDPGSDAGATPAPTQALQRLSADSKEGDEETRTAKAG